MRRTFTRIFLASLVVVAVAATSLTLRAQQREEELTGAFAAIRSALGSGSVGKIEADLWKRTFKISNIELQTDGTPPTVIKIRELSATGIDFPADWRLAAERIEALDVEIKGASSTEPAVLVSYKAPRVTLTDYNGPIAPLHQVDTSSAMDVARLLLEHIIASSATSLAIPTLTAVLTPTKAAPVGPIEYTYSGIGLRDLREGRIADMAIERTQFTLATPSDVLGRITGEGGRVSTADFDAGVLLAVLDPAKNKEDGFLRLQGRTHAGPYSLRFEKGGSMQIASIEVDTIAVRPAKLRFADLMELVEALGAGLNLGDDASAVANLMADMHEGIGMGLFELRGVSLELPQTPPFKLSTLRMKGYEHGKLAEFAIEGVEGQTPEHQPVKFARLALTGIDLANMARVAGAFGAGEATAEKFVALIPLLQGIEIKDLIAPYKDSSKSTVHIENFAVSWGQFIGPVPTSLRLTTRLTGPIEGGPDMLAGAGITSATMNFDLGAAWTEATRTFALSPISLDVANLFSLSARVSFGNVPREVFVADPDAAILAASEIEAGLVEFVLRDAGALDLALAQYAKQQGESVTATRAALVASLNEAAAPLVGSNPDLQQAVAAIAHFIETPKGALVIRVIPKGRVPIQSTIESAIGDPAAALTQFRIEVTSGP